jgi:hypothetical protein
MHTRKNPKVSAGLRKKPSSADFVDAADSGDSSALMRGASLMKNVTGNLPLQKNPIDPNGLVE